MEKFKCCENPDMVEVFYNNGKQGHRCWNCGYVFKDGEPHPEYLDIDEDLMNLFMNS